MNGLKNIQELCSAFASVCDTLQLPEPAPELEANVTPTYEAPGM